MTNQPAIRALTLAACLLSSAALAEPPAEYAMHLAKGEPISEWQFAIFWVIAFVSIILLYNTILQIRQAAPKMSTDGWCFVGMCIAFGFCLAVLGYFIAEVRAGLFTASAGMVFVPVILLMSKHFGS